MFLAASPSPGGYGFLIFVVFVITAIVIFVAMTRSMRRMRSHVDRGDFGAERPGRQDGQPAGREPGDPPAS